MLHDESLTLPGVMRYLDDAQITVVVSTSFRNCKPNCGLVRSVPSPPPSLHLSIHLDRLLLSDRILERINGISLRIIQLNPPPIIHCQRVLLCVKQSSPAPSPTPQFHLSTPLCPLDPEADVNAPVNLIDLALDPRVLARKVYLVSEFFAYERVGAQGVEGGGYDGGFLFLVVEEGEEGERHADYENWEGFQDLGRYKWRHAVEGQYCGCLERREEMDVRW
jgi:hypothetical protein